MQGTWLSGIIQQVFIVQLMHQIFVLLKIAVLNQSEICMEHSKKFYNLSPTRKGELEKQIKSKTDSTRLKLVNLCKTCLVTTAYETFYELLPAVISSIVVISSEPGWNTESSQKAATLLSDHTI